MMLLQNIVLVANVFVLVVFSAFISSVPQMPNSTAWVSTASGFTAWGSSALQTQTGRSSASNTPPPSSGAKGKGKNKRKGKGQKSSEMENTVQIQIPLQDKERHKYWNNPQRRWDDTSMEYWEERTATDGRKVFHQKRPPSDNVVLEEPAAFQRELHELPLCQHLLNLGKTDWDNLSNSLWRAPFTLGNSFASWAPTTASVESHVGKGAIWHKIEASPEGQKSFVGSLTPLSIMECLQDVSQMLAQCNSKKSKTRNMQVKVFNLAGGNSNEGEFDFLYLTPTAVDKQAETHNSCGDLFLLTVNGQTFPAMSSGRPGGNKYVISKTHKKWFLDSADEELFKKSVLEDREHDFNDELPSEKFFKARIEPREMHLRVKYLGNLMVHLRVAQRLMGPQPSRGLHDLILKGTTDPAYQPKDRVQWSAEFEKRLKTRPTPARLERLNEYQEKAVCF